MDRSVSLVQLSWGGEGSLSEPSRRDCGHFAYKLAPLGSTSASKAPTSAQLGPLGSNFGPQLGPIWEQLRPKLWSIWLQNEGHICAPIRNLQTARFNWYSPRFVAIRLKQCLPCCVLLGPKLGVNPQKVTICIALDIVHRMASICGN